MLQSSITTKIKSAKRLTNIFQVFAKNGVLGVLEKSGLDKILVGQSQENIEIWSEKSRENRQDDISIIAMKVRQAFEELGPVFVKLGQMLATRDDLIPPSFVHEFKKLHHSVTPLPYDVVEKILNDELAADQRSKIEKIDSKPLAAGSIGQIHKAFLTTGEAVVLKVRRPGVESLISQDISLLKILAKKLESYFERHFKIDIVQTVDALSRGLESEIDFTKEAANTEAIAQNFADWDFLVIPQVYWEISNSRILVLEFLDGHSPSNEGEAVNIDVLKNGVKMFMKMVLLDGEFHGDLHPGNLLILSDDRIGVIDFGLTYRLIDSQRMLLAGVFSSLIERDFVKLGRRLSEIGEPKDSFDVERFQLSLVNELTPLFKVRGGKVDVSGVIVSLLRVSAENDLFLPAYIVLIFKTLVLLESVSHQSKEEFDLFSISEELTNDLKHELEAFFNYKKQLQSTLEDTAYLAKVAPHQVRKILRSISKGNLHVQFESDGLKALSGQLTAGISFLSIALIFSSVLVSSAILVSSAGELSTIGTIGFVMSAVLAFLLVFKSIRSHF